VYKANREKRDAVTERDSVSGELQRVKKQKEELDKAVNEALDARNKLQGELDGKFLVVVMMVGYRGQEGAGIEGEGWGVVYELNEDIQGNT